MAIPLIAGHLRHILLKLLPSPEVKLVGRQLHISNHLDMVSDSLWAINAVILNANLRAVKQPKLKKWIQDVSAEIMDVQNILELIQDFCQQPKEQIQKVTTSPNLLPHDENISSSTFFISSHRHAILVDLKQIAQSLNCLLSRMVAFGLQIDMLESMDPKQAEYYSIMRQEVVYHHPLVCEVFQHRIWVDVLDSQELSFDHGQIAKECAKRLTGSTLSSVDIWSHINQSLAQTRFLLVLDGFKNIRQENKDRVEELMKNLLCCGAPGSRVIITCHYYPITGDDRIVNPQKIYDLKNISQQAWTKIFLRYTTPTTPHDQAKQNSSSTGMMDLTNLAKKMYEDVLFRSLIKAKGFGSILRHTTLSYSRFQKVQHNYGYLVDAHYISHESAQLYMYTCLFQPLPLSFAKGSFDMLVAEGIFNYSRYSQQKVQGIIHSNAYYYSQKNIGLIEPQLFQIERNMYHFRKKDHQEFKIPQQCRYLCILVDSDTNTFLTNLQVKIASNLRMLLLYKVKQEMCLQLQKFQEASSIEIPNTLGKNLTILSIVDIGIQQLPNRISTLIRLRYLNISEKEMEELPKSICDLYNLRVLSLSYCKYNLRVLSLSYCKKLLKLPEQIHNLAKLEILKLSYCTRLQMLPKSVSSLVNLQVLDIEACHWLKELPIDLRKLERLRSLNMIGCASLAKIPLGISELTDLQLLSGYIVDDYDNRSLTLKELESLTNIEQLHIWHLECVLNQNDITSVNLKYLDNLVLHWEWWNMDVRADDQIQSLKVINSFQPNVSHLKRLEIISYLGMQFPNWMTMDKELFRLETIRLINLKRCDNLSSLGILPSLLNLQISGLDSLTYVGNIISDDEVKFYHLHNLTLSEMPNLVEFNVRCHSLELLTLIHCPKLIRLFGFVLRGKLSIWLQGKMLEKYSWFHNIFKDIIELEIVGCHELRWLPEDIKNCCRLRELSVIRCSKILSMPDWLQKMSSLQKVLVSGCTSISHIPEELKQ